MKSWINVQAEDGRSQVIRECINALRQIPPPSAEESQEVLGYTRGVNRAIEVLESKFESPLPSSGIIPPRSYVWCVKLHK